jgi:hypothetical protein
MYSTFGFHVHQHHNERFIMKKRLAIVLMACAAMAACPRAARAQVDISAGIQINSPSDFYTPLQTYGSWVNVSSYGRCWHPSQVSTDWEPYTVGSWEWTDAGWYWNSDEPWAWACYHYGSWYQDPSVGWVWIPGTDWAPAWVTWRDSDDYIGWAPCGPGQSVLSPSLFVFCDIHKFHDHFSSRRDFIRDDARIIGRTHVIKDFQRQSIDFNGHQRTIFANRGPGVDPIQRATGQRFTARPVRDVIQQERRPENMGRDQSRQTDQRQGQRPEDQRQPAPTGREQQRNYQQQQHEATPAPTGREQQRNYQQPEQRTPQAQQQHEPTPAPTGREQQRNYQQQHEPTPAPTGREQQRNYQQPAQPAPAQRAPEVQQRPQTREVPNPAPEQRREVPAPSQSPSERSLPPTGRETAPRSAGHEATPATRAPEARQAPVQHQAPADGHAQDGNRDGNRQNQQ